MIPRFSAIIPVYNRPEEIDELLQSLTEQEAGNFEVLIIEDGSTIPCKEVVERYQSRMPIRYFEKPNTGPGDSRNFGMAESNSNYFVIFDSDCIIPQKYFKHLDRCLKDQWFDAFGGPDKAHESFTPIQKAINFAMTSPLTTGGIRGRAKQVDKFQPRSFNMGLSREVYETVGGFSSLHPGEDPDLSYRIQAAGFKTGLIPQAFVYHKRRIDFSKFWNQVYKFGLARTILMKWHPKSNKWIYALPSLGLLCGIMLFLIGFWIKLTWIALLMGLLLITTTALISTGSLMISILATWASAVQIAAYGWGFIKGFWHLHILSKDPHDQFPEMFFQQ